MVSLHFTFYYHDPDHVPTVTTSYIKMFLTLQPNIPVSTTSYYGARRNQHIFDYSHDSAFYEVSICFPCCFLDVIAVYNLM